jgi:hypothetical protein
VTALCSPSFETAWGDGSGADDRETWALVHFVRRLPQITPEEVESMRALNPKTQAEVEEARRVEEFLESGAPVAPRRK